MADSTTLNYSYKNIWKGLFIPQYSNGKEYLNLIGHGGGGYLHIWVQKGNDRNSPLLADFVDREYWNMTNKDMSNTFKFAAIFLDYAMTKGIPWNEYSWALSGVIEPMHCHWWGTVGGGEQPTKVHPQRTCMFLRWNVNWHKDTFNFANIAGMHTMTWQVQSLWHITYNHRCGDVTETTPLQFITNNGRMLDNEETGGTHTWHFKWFSQQQIWGLVTASAFSSSPNWDKLQDSLLQNHPGITLEDGYNKCLFEISDLSYTALSKTSLIYCTQPDHSTFVMQKCS